MKLTLVNVCIQVWFFNLIYSTLFVYFLICKFLAMIHNSYNYIKTTIFQHVFGILNEWGPIFIYYFARCIIQYIIVNYSTVDLFLNQSKTSITFLKMKNYPGKYSLYKCINMMNNRCVKRPIKKNLKHMRHTFYMFTHMQNTYQCPFIFTPRS